MSVFKDFKVSKMRYFTETHYDGILKRNVNFLGWCVPVFSRWMLHNTTSAKFILLGEKIIKQIKSTADSPN